MPTTFGGEPLKVTYYKNLFKIQ
ncbi:hypothetical protein, partial [Staphylococcus aureus]